jgi:predicted aspartyl protease
MIALEKQEDKNIKCYLKSDISSKPIKIESVPDSGVTKSILPRKLAKDLNMKVNKTKKIKMFNASGYAMGTEGTAKLLVRVIGSKHYKTIDVAVTNKLDKDKMMVGRSDMKILKILPGNFPAVIKEPSY